jgi:IPT/TIG domain
MVITGRSHLLCLLVVVLAAGFLSCGACAPKPFINSFSPNVATAGGNQFLLTVNGSDFRRDSMVSWNCSLRVTTFVSDQQLVVAISAADILAPGTVLVFVLNPPESNATSVSGAIGNSNVTVCSGKNSNAVSLTINP